MAEDVYERDVLELGERVADCLLTEELAGIYSKPQDRAWSLILMLYGYMIRAAKDDPADLIRAEEWRPHLNADGMWRMPGEVART